MDKELLERMGGPTAVAKICGITSQAVSQWSRVPAGRVLALEAATGVSRHDLRPDVFGPAPDSEGVNRAA